MAVIVAYATVIDPALGIGLAVLLVLGIAVLIRPNIATIAVAFLLYSNAPAVAVKFHDVPTMVSAAFLFLLVIPIGYYLLFRHRPIIITPVVPYLVLYLLIQLLSALFAARGVELAIPSLIVFVTEGLLVYLLVTNAVRTPEILRGVIWALLIAGLLMGALSLFQEVTNTLDNNYGGFAQNDEQTNIDPSALVIEDPSLVRQAGPIGEKNRYSQIMLMLVPLGLFRMWGERTKGLRFAAAICTIFALIGSALTFSRGGAVGLALMLLLMVSMRYIKIKQVLFIVAALMLTLWMFPRYTERLTTLQTTITAVADSDTTASIRQTDGAVQGRVTEMLAATYVFVDHPILGVGPGMFPYYVEEYSRQLNIRNLTAQREAHILYLGIAADTGLLGITCFLVILYITLRDLARERQRWRQKRPELANLCASFMFVIIAYMTTGLFLHMSYARYFWFMLALANMASYMASRASDSPASDTPASDNNDGPVVGVQERPSAQLGYNV
jgi:O-antigen ligase